MIEQLTHPPAVYRAESENASRFWWVWLPYLTAVVLIAVTAVNPQFVSQHLMNETTGLVEIQHALFPAIIAVLGIYMLTLRSTRAEPLRVAWCAALTLGAIYLAGEETSWGFHHFGWEADGFWQEVNDQQETNLHNISSWLDQKPRLILIIGIIITGIFMPWVLINRPELAPRFMDFTYTPIALVPLAVLVFLSWFYKDLTNFFGFTDMQALRGGEFQETFIVWYLLGYTLFLVRRARKSEQALSQA
ncbi:hypothetical protein ACFQ14_07745 [Pseudahrensia aquimaris]|uniref:DUF998 domain-containing protein n=1 Tax=Pseudahrensia aquimaris TaxID=744461 RepID=A0ABW3FEE4_9HYPH